GERHVGAVDEPATLDDHVLGGRTLAHTAGRGAGLLGRAGGDDRATGHVDAARETGRVGEEAGQRGRRAAAVLAVEHLHVRAAAGAGTGDDVVGAVAIGVGA